MWHRHEKNHLKKEQYLNILSRSRAVNRVKDWLDIKTLQFVSENLYKSFDGFKKRRRTTI